MIQRLPRALPLIAALAVLSACDRPLASPANAVDTLAQRNEDVSQDPTAARSAAPPPAARTPSPAETSDAAITARVNSALHADPALAGADVSVNTANGVVSLTGSVKSPEQVAEASARAQEPDGVVRIDSHLSVIPP